MSEWRQLVEVAKKHRLLLLISTLVLVVSILLLSYLNRGSVEAPFVYSVF